MTTVSFLRDAVLQEGGIRAAGRLLNMPESTIRTILKRASADDYSVSEVPKIVDIEDLIEERKRKFAKLKEATNAARTRTIRLKTNKPIGIGFVGDAHIDDDGTDIAQALQHAELFSGQHPGLYGAFLGDVWNNWTGRLTRLWSEQSTNNREAQALVEHYFNMVQWLFVLLGNHDVWNGKTDILEYMLSQNTSIVSPHEQHVKLIFPNGREVTIHARHTFPGSSQWIKQFGQIKTAALSGMADIYVGGDKHVSGYTNGWHDGQKRMFHAVQVCSYKAIDDYPVELGLTPADFFVCPVALIDPRATNPLNFIRWEFDPNEGAERLAWLRSR